MLATRLHAACFALVLTVVASACGDDDAPSRFPYDPDETVIVGAEGAQVQNAPSGDACIEIASGACVQPQNQCGEGAYADVLLDSTGDVNQSFAFPSRQKPRSSRSRMASQPCLTTAQS